MRILILRPLLFSQASFEANRERVTRVVEVARDTIRVLAHLDATSDIYRKQQVMFNHFLCSALSVLSLVLAHEPQQRQQEINGKSDGGSTMPLFSSAREEIYLALELVKSYSTYSTSSKRVWKTFSTLKELLSRLGLLKQDDSKEPQSLATEPEIRFSELYHLLGEDGRAFSEDVSAVVPQGLGTTTTTDSSMAATDGWHSPQNIDLSAQWGDPNIITGLSDIFGGQLQDSSWAFQSLL